MIQLHRNATTATRDNVIRFVSTQPDQRLLVDLNQSVGIQAPLFCIHPSGGDIGVYRKFAKRMPKDLPIVAIQSRLLVGEASEFTSIVEMAMAYAELIVSHQPVGSIRLLGFSFGGFVASQIVCELEKRGRTVSFLGLVDSDLGWLDSNRSGRDELVLRLKQLAQKFQDVGLISRIPEEESSQNISELVDEYLNVDTLGLSDIMNDVHERGLKIRSEADAEVLGKFVFNFITHCRMLQNFSPTEVGVPTYAWWPSDSVGNDDVSSNEKNVASDWQWYVRDPIQESVLEGSHYSIMRMPTAKKLANSVQDILSNA